MTDVFVEHLLRDLLGENVLLLHDANDEIVEDEILDVLRKEFEDLFLFDNLVKVGESLKVISMDSSGVVHLLLKLLERVWDYFGNIRSQVHFLDLVLDSFGLGKLIELGSQVVLLEIGSSFALLDLLMDLVFHLVNSVMIVGDLERSSVDFELLKVLIDLAVSEVNLSDKFLKLFRVSELNDKILSIGSGQLQLKRNILLFLYLRSRLFLLSLLLSLLLIDVLTS